MRSRGHVAKSGVVQAAASSRSPPPLRPGRLTPGPGLAARSALEGAQVREDRRT